MQGQRQWSESVAQTLSGFFWMESGMNAQTTQMAVRAQTEALHGQSWFVLACSFTHFCSFLLEPCLCSGITLGYTHRTLWDVRDQIWFSSAYWISCSAL